MVDHIGIVKEIIVNQPLSVISSLSLYRATGPSYLSSYLDCISLDYSHYNLTNTLDLNINTI